MAVTWRIFLVALEEYSLVIENEKRSARIWKKFSQGISINTWNPSRELKIIVHNHLQNINH